MSNLPIFDVAGSAMQAQSVRLNTVASNLANANTVAGTPEGAGLHTVDHCTRSIPSDNGYSRSGVSMKIRVTTGTVWPSRVSSTMS